MNRNRIAAMVAALTLGGILVPASGVIAQDNANPPATPDNATSNLLNSEQHPIAWSFADYQPSVSRGDFTGLYIWHDRNTVHVETTDNHWFGDDFKGSIEIENGTIDNVVGEHDRADTRFHQVAKNKLIFEFSAQDPHVDGFKFNIHKGDRLVFHVGLNDHRTGRIFYGSAKAPTDTDPVVFDLKK